MEYADRYTLEEEIIRRHAACEEISEDAKEGVSLPGGMLQASIQESKSSGKAKAPVRIE